MPVHRYNTYKDFCDRLDSREDILDKLFVVFGVNTAKELSEELGITEQAIFRVKSSGRVPDRWILYAAYKRKIPYHTILSLQIDELKQAISDKYVWIKELGNVTFSEEKNSFVETFTYKRIMVNNSIAGGIYSENELVLYRALTTAMEPTIRIGQYIILYKNISKLYNNGMYFISIGSNLLLCRIHIQHKRLLLSFDAEHIKAFDVEEDEIHIYGRVISTTVAL